MIIRMIGAMGLAVLLHATAPGGVALAAESLSADQVRLVRESWAKIEPRIPKTLDRFYHRYFQLDPAAEPLFDQQAMENQYRALAGIMGDLAAGCDDLDQFATRLKRLGGRHQSLGAEPHQFNLFGIAFVDTLRLELGPDFAPGARNAWNKIFYEVAKMMEAGYNR